MRNHHRLTHDELKAAEAAFHGWEFNDAWEVREMNLSQRPNSYKGKGCLQWAFVAKKVMAERDLLRLTVHELEAKLDLYVSQAQEANRR
jgi:hypothetical protein